MQQECALIQRKSHKKGTISYQINGKNYGIAFNDPSLKLQPLFPAVALFNSGDELQLTFNGPED